MNSKSWLEIVVHMAFNVALGILSIVLMIRFLDGTAVAPGWYIWPALVVGLLWGMAGGVYWLDMLLTRWESKRDGMRGN